MRRGNGERGAAAVEFALLLPLLVVIIFGTIEFGIAFSKMESYISAAREGARYAAVECQPNSQALTTCDSGNTLVQQEIAGALGSYPAPSASELTVVVSNPANGSTYGNLCTQQTIGDNVSVSWPQTLTVQIPFLPTMTLTPTITGVFRCE